MPRAQKVNDCHVFSSILPPCAPPTCASSASLASRCAFKGQALGSRTLGTSAQHPTARMMVLQLRTVGECRWPLHTLWRWQVGLCWYLGGIAHLHGDCEVQKNAGPQLGHDSLESYAMQSG